jgi:uncharacterized protein YndB with AHSA1/START domain
MSTLNHNTFSLEREYPVPPATVFRHFADPALKQKWFGTDEGWTSLGSGMDFRVGGVEFDEGRWDNGTTSRFESRYLEIVEDLRLVYVYGMVVNDARLSDSLASIELTATDGGTLLRLTEQGVYYDGHEDPAMREQGTAWILDNLGKALAQA